MIAVYVIIGIIVILVLAFIVIYSEPGHDRSLATIQSSSVCGTGVVR